MVDRSQERLKCAARARPLEVCETCGLRFLSTELYTCTMMTVDRLASLCRILWSNKLLTCDTRVFVRSNRRYGGDIGGFEFKNMMPHRSRCHTRQVVRKTFGWALWRSTEDAAWGNEKKCTANLGEVSNARLHGWRPEDPSKDRLKTLQNMTANREWWWLCNHLRPNQSERKCAFIQVGRILSVDCYDIFFFSRTCRSTRCPFSAYSFFLYQRVVRWERKRSVGLTVLTDNDEFSCKSR